MCSPHRDGSRVIAVISQSGVISLKVLYENAGKKDRVWRKIEENEEILISDKIELRMSPTRNTVIHASLSNNYVLELVIGKGALKDTFL